MMRLLLVGFGNVARTLASILGPERPKFPGLDGFFPLITGVVTRSRGCLFNQRGIDLAEALSDIHEAGGFRRSNRSYSTLGVEEQLASGAVDVLVELSTLEIAQSGEPAAGYIRKAFELGCDVVTANKGPLAFHFRELTELARGKGRKLLYESTVMDGTPIFSLVRQCLPACRVVGFEGILNSTTNFVLGRLEAGWNLEAAVEEAQRRGFAEADPSLDLDGWDAAAKAAVLSNALMNACITPHDVKREALSDIPPQRLAECRGVPGALRMVVGARLSGGKLEASMESRILPPHHPFCSVQGPGSVIRIETDLMAPLVIQQVEPGLYDTAAGVLHNLLELAREDRTDPPDPSYRTDSTDPTDLPNRSILPSR